MAQVTAYFQQGGGLSDTLSQFELRPTQVELVEAIELAIDQHQHLVAEAGTGIGKTFAYLLPTLAKEKKIVISTATKHLQDQVFFKDLPVIEKILGREVSSCLLKGRSNYFCHYRYQHFLGSSFGLTQRQSKQVAKIQDWLAKTRSGDLSEIADFVAADHALKKQMTSTTENCLAGECPNFDTCFIQKAREKAKKSEVVIVNHALLMADIVLKETGFAEILPEVDVVVIDEAHHLPATATQAFAEKISANQLLELAKDALQIHEAEGADVKGFSDVVETFTVAVNDWLQTLLAEQNTGQIQLGKLKQLPQPYAAFKTLMQAFKALLETLSAIAERSHELEGIYDRAQVMAARIKHIFASTKALVEADEIAIADTSETPSESVAILEWNPQYFLASRSPIHLGTRFQNVMGAYADSWLFVSATLSVGDSFDYFVNALGLPADITTRKVDSPFDYQRHAVIHVLSALPAPNHPNFVEALVDASQLILEKTQGRAFMLFTSYKNLYEASELMRDSGFELFIQGEGSKSQLVDAFMQSENAVLMGTVSFWEGVDIAGDKLSCVIIDKIPFPSPGDPVIAEQSRYLEQQGQSSFAHCYLPRAAMLLKQGAGRLIRSQRDKGVLVFGDNRLLQKSYGQQLIMAMPPAKLVDYDELCEFIEVNLG